MKITIDTDILRKYNLSLEEYIILLSSYYNIDYIRTQEKLANKDLIEKNLFKDFPPIISNNTKDLVAKIMIESSDKLQDCGIDDFQSLAQKLQACFPEGIKAGKTYSWRGTVENIILKLQILIVKYDFLFTEEEAISAAKEYVSSFKPPYTYMHTLQNFLLYTKKEGNEYEMESIFMTIIENNRSTTTSDFTGCDIGDLEDALG